MSTENTINNIKFNIINANKKELQQIDDLLNTQEANLSQEEYQRILALLLEIGQYPKNPDHIRLKAISLIMKNHTCGWNHEDVIDEAKDQLVIILRKPLKIYELDEDIAKWVLDYASENCTPDTVEQLMLSAIASPYSDISQTAKCWALKSGKKSVVTRFILTALNVDFERIKKEKKLSDRFNTVIDLLRLFASEKIFWNIILESYTRICIEATKKEYYAPLLLLGNYLQNNLPYEIAVGKDSPAFVLSSLSIESVCKLIDFSKEEYSDFGKLIEDNMLSNVDSDYERKLNCYFKRFKGDELCRDIISIAGRFPSKKMWKIAGKIICDQLKKDQLKKGFSSDQLSILDSINSWLPQPWENDYRKLKAAALHRELERNEKSVLYSVFKEEIEKKINKQNEEINSLQRELEQKTKALIESESKRDGFAKELKSLQTKEKYTEEEIRFLERKEILKKLLILVRDEESNLPSEEGNRVINNINYSVPQFGVFPGEPIGTKKTYDREFDQCTDSTVEDGDPVIIKKRGYSIKTLNGQEIPLLSAVTEKVK